MNSSSAYHYVPSSCKLIDEDETNQYSEDEDDEVEDNFFTINRKANYTPLSLHKDGLLIATENKKDFKYTRKPRTKSFNETTDEIAHNNVLRTSFKRILMSAKRRKDSDDNESDPDDLFHDKKTSFLSRSFDDKKKTLHINTSAQCKKQEPDEVISSTSTSSSSSYNSSSRSETTLSSSTKKIDFNKDQIIKFANSNQQTQQVAAIHLDDLTKNKIKKQNDSIRMRHHSNANKTILNQADLVSSGSVLNVNNSSCVLVDSKNNNKNEDPLKEMSSSASLDSADKVMVKCIRKSKREKHSHNMFIIFLLFVVNLLNFIDRYTLAGVLKETQDYFKIDDSSSGLLQTVFICSYMLLAPLFGYLGDRYPRKWIIIFGVSFWSLMTFLGSFVPPEKFWIFLILRSLVGIGEASYSCIAPTIIGDLFTGQTRTKMLAIFYLAVPVGSGLGYIVGSNIAAYFNDWRWALRFTPPLGFVCVILLIFFVREPKRGGAEGSINYEDNKASMLSDVIYLLKNKTFMWVTAGFTFSSFVLGGLSWWVPLYVQYAIYSNEQVPEQIPLLFGVVTCFSGLLGVTLSSVTAPKLRSLKPYADALVCAVGSLIAVPALFVLILITRTAHPIIFWAISGIAISALCLSWTLVSDILLYVIHPNKRSTASAFNILICHLFGDAGSPYVIGAISDFLRSGKPDTYFNRFYSLQTALYAGPFFSVLSFASYLFATIYLEEDKKKVDLLIKKNQKLNEESNKLNESTSNETSRCDDYIVGSSSNINNLNNFVNLIDSSNDVNEKLDQVKNINENFKIDNNNNKRKLSLSNNKNEQIS